MATTLLRTPLHGRHAALGARITDFAGWEMPLQYTRVAAEHQAVREAAGVFDVSHMGLLAVHGSSAGDFLERMVPQDLSVCVPGRAVYTQLLNAAGGILDDLIVYRLPASLPGLDGWPAGGWMLIVNASNAEADLAWLRQHAPTDVTLTPLNDGYGLLALQGPAFAAALAALGCPSEALPKRFRLAAQTLTLPEPVPVLMARTGYTGEDGVELVVPAAQLPAVWDALLDHGVTPCGLAARDSLRLEAGYPLHGHEIDPETTPLEAGLGWSVKLNKPTPFIGQAALREQPPRTRLVGFRVEDRRIPRPQDAVLRDGRPLGHVTSGAFSPTLGVPIGLARVPAEGEWPVGTPLTVDIRGTACPATLVTPPFTPTRPSS